MVLYFIALLKIIFLFSLYLDAHLDHLIVQKKILQILDCYFFEVQDKIEKRVGQKSVIR